MSDLANQLDTTAVQETGTVIAEVGDGYLVRAQAGDYRARRATSCLLEPRPDDLVLLASLADGRCYLLAVLDRDKGDKATVCVDGDLELRVDAGRFTVAAQQGVGITSAKDVSLVSGSLEVNTLAGKVVVQSLSYLGRTLVTEIEKVKTFAGAIDQVLERFSQRVKRSYRTVEELDQVRAERVDYSAKKNMSLRGHNTVVTAEELVKIDGEQIHLG